MKIPSLLLFIFTVTTSYAEDILSPRAYLTGSTQDSQNYDGNVIQAGIEVSPTKDAKISAGIEHLKRHYDSGDIEDTSLLLGTAQTYNNGKYLESYLSYSADAEIVPKLNIAVVPHFAWLAADIGIGFNYREYKTVKAGSISPSLYYEFNDTLATQAGIYIVRSDETLTSGSMSLIYKTHAKHTWRFGAAGGESLEDAGVSTSFKSVNALYTLPLTERFQMGFEAGRFWSDLRDETTYGIRLEFK